MKIVCMLAVFNNVGFIEEIINYYLSEGLELVILDDGSTDGTYEICKKYSNRNDVELLQVKHEKWEHTTIFKILYDMALLKSPDWVIRPDSDEILESGINGISLKDAILKVDSEGYNTIQFDWFEFFLTDNDDESTVKVKDRMKYYSWQYDYLYRAWKVVPGIKAELGWGHLPVFPEHQKYKIYPQKFVARHYRFISVEQANQKISTVLSRTEDHKEEKSSESTHYRMIDNKKSSFVIDHSLLTKYNDDNNWNLERKFYPYIRKIPRTKDEIFNEDGTLKMKIADIAILRIKSNRVPKLLKKVKELREKNEVLKEKNFGLKNKLKNYSLAKIMKDPTLFTYSAIEELEVTLSLLEKCVNSDLEGDVIECGVYKGGSSISIAKKLADLGSKKKLYALDTFEGHPYDDASDMPEELKKEVYVNKFPYVWKGKLNDVNLDEIKNKFNEENLDNTIFLKGLFEDSFKKILDKQFCFAHVDADTYVSVKQCIEFLKDRLVSNGIILFDDYNSPGYLGCNKAVDDLLGSSSLTLLKRHRAYWIKP